MPTASKKRQKHNFIISISFSKRFSYHMKKDIKVQAEKIYQGEEFLAMLYGFVFRSFVCYADCYSRFIFFSSALNRKSEQKN